MINHNDGKRRCITEYMRHSHRFLAALLCLCMVLSMLGSAITFTVWAAEGSTSYTKPAQTSGTEPAKETQEEIKARLVRQIREEGWDPYSADMMIDEFYALMELFQEGTLPLEDDTANGAVSIGAPSFAAPGIGLIDDTDPDNTGTNPPFGEEEIYIPRTMFLFSGLTPKDTKDSDNNPIESLPGKDSNGNEYGAPLNYDTVNGAEDDLENYPAGLDPYNNGYTLPPKDWKGVKVEEQDNGALQAIVIFADINKDKPTISGDVVQDLFLKYDDRYVRRVTAQNTEVAVLGAIKLSGQDEYVYYYLTSKDQHNDVSTTTLPKGQKFIVEYLPIEHKIEYRVYFEDANITGLTPDNTPNINETVNVLGKYMPNTTWENIIFGAEHPDRTDGGGYSFTAYAPYGYTVEFYLIKEEDSGTSGSPIPMLTTSNEESKRGKYKDVNNGWALGMEPVYSKYEGGFTVQPDTIKGPGTLTMSGAIYNNDVHHDRTIIAVVTKNGAPVFDASKVLTNSDGAVNRATAADENYDWDADYAYSVKGQGDNPYPSRAAGWPNLAKIDDNGSWNWQTSSYKTTSKTMREDETPGTYSYQWTFQTNSSENYVLDSLAINGVGITIPFYPRYSQSGTGTATGHGTSQWHTETTLPDGATLRVEYLFLTNGNQRHYRISVTGARSNVTITGLNLMQYRGGAAEFSVYHLDGVTGATTKDEGNSTHTAAIQYYGKDNNGSLVYTWNRNIPQGNIVVTKGDYSTGDGTKHGANIRFKLADGYDSPYYLWESTQSGVIDGQASIERNVLTGEVDYSSIQDILLLSDLGENELMDSQHIYKGDDDWYYIRVTTQGDYKIALLTIVARQVRYVVRYVPSYVSANGSGGTRAGSFVGVVDNPDGMPEFTHDGEHDSFLWETDNGIDSRQYDTKDGAYYDTTVDDVAILPTTVPVDTDRSRQDGVVYRFVDWVLVDENYNPIWAWTNANETVQVATDQYGNRILVTPVTINGDTVLRPALWDGDKLIFGYDYIIQWNSTDNKYELYQNGVPVKENKWVTLTRDGKLAYASTGALVGMPDTTDWTSLLTNWFVLDYNGNAAVISDCSEFHYRANHITLVDVNQYAIPNENLGGDETDIYVLRLMPMWEPIDNPFNYSVALNWVDAQGTVHEEFFADYWSAVITDWEIKNGGLTVQVIKDAGPFKNWIAMHPTYTFWDEVNNNNALFRYFQDNPDAKMDDPEAMEKARNAMTAEMQKEVDKYLSELSDEAKKEVVKKLSKRDISGKDSDGNRVEDNNGNGTDDFWRLGGYAFQVFEDDGTIVVWMYEDKGGLTFRKEVANEPFIANDEFYFTVNQVQVGSQNQSNLDGVYKAYPENVYDDNGARREVVDTDAWLVTFTDGKITSIVKNDGSHEPATPVTWFTLKSGEGIRLFVPAGNYTITELGSKSGGSYRVSVQYDGSSDPSLSSSWSLPDGHLWLKGQDTEYHDPANLPAGVLQVSATVYFEIGESNMVHTLQFNNMTATLSIEKTLDATDEYKQDLAEWLAADGNKSKLFHFAVELELPVGYTPLEGESDDGNVYYYFNINIYNANGSFVRGEELVLANKTGTDRWKGTIDLQAGQRAAIVMTAPDDEKPLYYEYIENNSSVIAEITDPNGIIVGTNGIPYYRNANGQYCRIYYYAGTEKVYIESAAQIQNVTRTDGEPYLANTNGDHLYYYIGRGDDGIMDFDQITGAPSEVTLRYGPVDDGLYSRNGVYGEIDVPLYYYDDSEYKLIDTMATLKKYGPDVYYRYGDKYYPVALKPVEDDRFDDKYTYEGVYVGLYNEEIAIMLKKKFTVWSSRNGSDFSEVNNLNDVVVRVDTVTVPVSKELFNYEFKEVWNKDDWAENDWDSVGNKTNLFNEVWTGQTGIAETGVTTKAKVVNWFGVAPVLFELPDTGGTGTLGLRLLGGALISAAVIFTWHFRKRRSRSV